MVTFYLWSHFAFDVTVTSFYMGLTPKFNTTLTIYAGICVLSFTRIILRVAKILRGRKWGQKMSPSAAAGGWRGGVFSSGTEIKAPPINAPKRGRSGAWALLAARCSVDTIEKHNSNE